MRAIAAALILLMVALAGCSDSGSEPGPADDPVLDEGNDSSQMEDEVPADDDGEPAADDPVPTDNETVNTAPIVDLTASSQLGEVPLEVGFTLNGTDAEGDALSWSFDANGDGIMEGQGSELPTTINFTFEEGTYNATMWLSDGEFEVNQTLEIVAFVGAPPIATETYYLHDEDGGDGTMDHAPASGAEGGNGLANLLGVGYTKSFPTTEPTTAYHAAGTPVEVRVQAFSLLPHPLVEMTGSLTLNGAVIGTGSDTQTPVAVALVSTPCTEWVMSFETSAEVPTGSDLQLDITASNLYPMAGCYPGGEDGPRVVFNP